jgi:hypothetical protein
MASWILVVVAAIIAEPSATEAIPSVAGPSGYDRQAAAVQPRGFHEFPQQISELLKREGQAKTSAARAAAVRELCDLHGEIVHDPRYANSDVLKEYRGRIWSRLTKVKAELKQQLARSKAHKESLETLASLEAADSLSVAAADSLASSLGLLEQLQSGPGQLLALGGRAGPADFGPDLVDLIERTINPAFWDVVGGPGTIVYYAPLQCLVVRATAEVHGNIGGVLGGLRNAGR